MAKKYLNRYFTKEYIHIANKYIKTLPISLVIKEIIKATIRYHFTYTEI